MKSYFEVSNLEANFRRKTLDGLDFPKISEEDYAQLIVPFTKEGVNEEIWGCDGNKSLSPYGFNLNFIKECQEVVKGDIMGFFTEFHASAVLPKALTDSFLALVPKKEHPQGLKEYRLICPIGCFYNILTKVLAKRLKKVL